MTDRTEKTITPTGFDHVLVCTTGAAGYWGRGETLAAALKAAQWINPEDEVIVYGCVADAHVDALGNTAYGVDTASKRTGQAISLLGAREGQRAVDLVFGDGELESED